MSFFYFFIKFSFLWYLNLIFDFSDYAVKCAVTGESGVIGWDEDNDEAQDRWIPATRGEREDPKVQKYYTDAWRNAYIYRCNRGRKSQTWMLNSRSYDFYSLGPDGEDGTVLGDEAEDEEDNDDISNSW